MQPLTPVLLLHGALGAAAQLQPLVQQLEPYHEVHTLNFSGHGNMPFSDKGFSVPVFAEELLGYLQQHQLQRPAIFGYSMGGYVAMYLARHHPEHVGKVITLATKYNWNEATASREVKQLDPAVMEAKVPAYTAILAERHAPNDWKKVVQRTAQLIEDLGHASLLKAHDFAAITAPCLLMMGDRDNMVGFTETIEAYKSLPVAQFTAMPDTPHPFEKVDMPLLSYFIRRFIVQQF